MGNIIVVDFRDNEDFENHPSMAYLKQTLNMISFLEEVPELWKLNDFFIDSVAEYLRIKRRQVEFVKLNHAVVPEAEFGTSEIASVLPPAVYPPAVATSFEVVYAVVVALSVAEEVYKAILKTSAAVLPRTTPTPKL